MSKIKKDLVGFEEFLQLIQILGVRYLTVPPIFVFFLWVENTAMCSLREDATLTQSCKNNLSWLPLCSTWSGKTHFFLWREGYLQSQLWRSFLISDSPVTFQTPTIRRGGIYKSWKNQGRLTCADPLGRVSDALLWADLLGCPIRPDNVDN